MQKIKNKIKAIIFDMDGTIINTEHVWQKAVINAIKDEGVKITEQFPKFFGSLFGIGMVPGTILIKEKFKLKSSVQKLVEKQLKLANQYFAATTTSIHFIEGFEQFHKKLQQNLFVTGIATNADLLSINQIDKKINLRGFFGKNIYCMDHVNHKSKPDPAVFIHAIKALNVKPKECIIFEDSPHGFRAAKSAGIKCIAIKNRLNDKYLKLADASIDNYWQAEETIKNLILKGELYGKEIK